MRSTTGRAGRRSYASFATYSEIAQSLGLGLCAGGCGVLTDDQHERGTAEITPYETIHWRERRINRRGFRRFLMLAVSLIWPEARQGNDWEVLYRQNRYAGQLALEFGVRFPRAWSELDRARIRLWLRRQRWTELDREFPEQRALIRRVTEWARA